MTPSTSSTRTESTRTESTRTESTPTESTPTDPVSRLLDAVVAGTGVPSALFAPGAALDATIPGFRFAQHEPGPVAGQLSSWFADPGSFAHLLRTPLPGGGAELVRFLLTWLEHDQVWSAHQVHVIEHDGRQITRVQMWCGGRWDSARQKEIAAAM
jgi:hypothetical protein